MEASKSKILFLGPFRSGKSSLRKLLSASPLFADSANEYGRRGSLSASGAKSDALDHHYVLSNSFHTPAPDSPQLVLSESMKELQHKLEQGADIFFVVLRMKAEDPHHATVRRLLDSSTFGAKQYEKSLLVLTHCDEQCVLPLTKQKAQAEFFAKVRPDSDLAYLMARMSRRVVMVCNRPDEQGDGEETKIVKQQARQFSRLAIETALNDFHYHVSQRTPTSDSFSKQPQSQSQAQAHQNQGEKMISDADFYPQPHSDRMIHRMELAQAPPTSYSDYLSLRSREFPASSAQAKPDAFGAHDKYHPSYPHSSQEKFGSHGPSPDQDDNARVEYHNDHGHDKQSLHLEPGIGIGITKSQPSTPHSKPTLLSPRLTYPSPSAQTRLTLSTPRSMNPTSDTSSSDGQGLATSLPDSSTNLPGSSPIYLSSREQLSEHAQPLSTEPSSTYREPSLSKFDRPSVPPKPMVPKDLLRQLSSSSLSSSFSSSSSPLSHPGQGDNINVELELPSFVKHPVSMEAEREKSLGFNSRDRDVGDGGVGNGDDDGNGNGAGVKADKLDLHSPQQPPLHLASASPSAPPPPVRALSASDTQALASLSLSLPRQHQALPLDAAANDDGGGSATDEPSFKVQVLPHDNSSSNSSTSYDRTSSADLITTSLPLPIQATRHEIFDQRASTPPPRPPPPPALKRHVSMSMMPASISKPDSGTSPSPLPVSTQHTSSNVNTVPASSPHPSSNLHTVPSSIPYERNTISANLNSNALQASSPPPHLRSATPDINSVALSRSLSPVPLAQPSPSPVMSSQSAPTFTSTPLSFTSKVTGPVQQDSAPEPQLLLESIPPPRPYTPPILPRPDPQELHQTPGLLSTSLPACVPVPQDLQDELLVPAPLGIAKVGGVEPVRQRKTKRRLLYTIGALVVIVIVLAILVGVFA